MDRGAEKGLEQGLSELDPAILDQDMKARKRVREEEAQLTPLQELWQAVRKKDAAKLRRVLTERRAQSCRASWTRRTQPLYFTRRRWPIASVKLLLLEGPESIQPLVSAADAYFSRLSLDL